MSLGEQLAGQAARAQALHQPLMQAAGALEAAAAVMEGAVQHSVAHRQASELTGEVYWGKGAGTA